VPGGYLGQSFMYSNNQVLRIQMVCNRLALTLVSRTVPKKFGTLTSFVWLQKSSLEVSFDDIPMHVTLR